MYSMENFNCIELPLNIVQMTPNLVCIIFLYIRTQWGVPTIKFQNFKNKDHPKVYAPDV